jgi:hypothetical protein
MTNLTETERNRLVMDLSTGRAIGRLSHTEIHTAVNWLLAAMETFREGNTVPREVLH